MDMAVLVPLWPPGETGESIPEPACPKDCEIEYDVEGGDEAALMNDDPGGERLIMDDCRE